MCGLAGYLGRPDATRAGAAAGAVLDRMGQRIAHRGPDDAGIWTDDAQGIGLVHRRLSIIDLSPAGHQPMTSASGRYVLAFNGEIYNHQVLRAELEASGRAPEWRGHSDTETLIAAIEAWDVAGALSRIVGMFAFALWDRAQNRLVLARDRLGEKPLYYGWQGTGPGAVLLFGSELKALATHPAFDDTIDRAALASFLRLSSVPAPQSIYRSVRKLPPGCYVSLSLDDRDAAPVTYWSGAGTAVAGAEHRFSGSPDEAVDRLEQLLGEVLKGQMLADVPLGAFLSGGVDSASVVSIMQVHASRPVQTFTLGFNEAGFDEAVHAKAVARHLGTDHHEMYVSPDDAMRVIADLPHIYDEPFADSSQIPTILISHLASRHVKVALSGDGGDELFCGYNRYRRAANVWRRLSMLPLPARRGLQRALGGLPMPVWSFAGSMLSRSREVTRPITGEKMQRTAGLIGSASVGDFYAGLTSRWPQSEQLVVGVPAAQEPALAVQQLTPVEQMMARDLVDYLPNEILVKVDRASMASSLEVRTPMLDHRLVEFAWSLPLDYKVRDNRSKWPLRRLLDRHVPRELIDRPKRGFGVPLAEWLRGPLRGWADALLDETRLAQEGYLNPEPIRRAWIAHQSGRIDLHNALWNVLMFQTWLEQRRLPAEQTAVQAAQTV